MTKASFKYGLDQLTPELALKIARGQVKGEIVAEVRSKLEKSCTHVQEIAQGDKLVYSINTGFGTLCNTRIAPEQTKKLQQNILRSHSVGVGNPISNELAKLMLITKVQSLSMGYSGIAPETVDRICWHIDNDLIPLVPEQGSVGASGDLAPLAHLFLPLVGLGKISRNGSFVDSIEILKEHGLGPLDLGPKEGLALINGTQFIVAHAVEVIERMHNCLETADLVGALSLESLLGSAQPFRADLHQLRPHPGAKLVAGRLTKLLEGSELVHSHADCDRVQDPYSLRCMPQVHGTSRDAYKHLREQLITELNSVTDNPIIFSADDTISGGNFHGQPLALPLDYSCFASSELGNISDRRIYMMLEGKYGLPLLLMNDPGINSGFMLLQYTSAALASENKTYCFPASADSIPTSLGQEDHVSMGSISGRKALMVVENVEKIFAIEMLCAAQAFDFRRPLKSSKILEACHEHIRKRVSHANEDRVFADDMEIAHQMIVKGELLDVAAKAGLSSELVGVN